ATAAALEARGLKAAILEKSGAVGAVWRRHYDRLHLHTDRARSALPGLEIPKACGRYPSRAHVVEYLEAYAETFALKPAFDAPVHAVRRDGRAWRAEAGENSRTAPIVVVATGSAGYPHVPAWPGMDEFGGPILHSSVYRNPAPFAGKRVLVIGCGNSGAGIALDLAEAGVDVTLAVRGPVNVIPRELFGVPILAWGLAGRLFPARIADIVNAPLLRFAIGRIETLGLKRSPKGPLQAIEEDGRVPVIDIGTLDAIRDGRITLRGEVTSFARDSVAFRRSPPERFCATPRACSALRERRWSAGRRRRSPAFSSAAPFPRRSANSGRSASRPSASPRRRGRRAPPEAPGGSGRAPRPGPEPSRHPHLCPNPPLPPVQRERDLHDRGDEFEHDQ